MRVNDDYSECNVEQQIHDAESVFNFWRRVLKLRSQFRDIFVYGRFEMVEHDHDCVMCYKRISASAVATVIMNFSGHQQVWNIPPGVAGKWDSGRVILSNYENRGIREDYQVILRPFEAVVTCENQIQHHL
jgi:glycosidase